MLTLCLLTGAAHAAPPDGFEAYDRSLAMVRGEMSRHPRSAELSLVLAQLHFEANRFSDALEVYTEGSKTHPNDLRFVTGLGRTYLAQGELDRAIDLLERALAGTTPDSPARAVRLPLADAYLQAAKFSSAIEQLRAAAREPPPSADILLTLGRTLDTESRRLRSQGSAEAAQELAAEARRSLEDAIRLRPGYADAHYALSRLFASRGEKELARQRLDDFRRLKRARTGVDERQLAFASVSLEAGTAVRLARALSAIGDTDRALDFATRALAVLPRFEPAMVARGTILLQARRTEDAKRAFEELLAARPGHPTALAGLAEIRALESRRGKR